MFKERDFPVSYNQNASVNGVGGIFFISISKKILILCLRKQTGAEINRINI